MKKTLLLLITAILFCGCDDFSENPLNLTVSEIEWIKTHKEISLAIDYDNIPLNYADKNGNIVGYNVDLLELIEKKLNLKINLISSDWDTSFKRAVEFEVDGIVNVDSTKERKKYFNFTIGYFNSPKTLICRGNFSQQKDLTYYKKYKIAAKKNTIHSEILKSFLPEENLVEFDSLANAVELLRDNKIQCIFDDFSPLGYWLNKKQVTHVSIGYTESYARQASFGFRKDKPILKSMFDKAIKSVSKEEKNLLFNKWIKKSF